MTGCNGDFRLGEFWFRCGVTPNETTGTLLCDDCRRKPPEPLCMHGLYANCQRCAAISAALMDDDIPVTEIEPATLATLATDQAALDAIRDAVQRFVPLTTDNGRDVAHAVATALDELAAKRAAR